MSVRSAAGATPLRGHAIVIGIACSSAAALIFEIALTRIFSITQFYHFAFMTVSLALLGFGASGSALTAFPRLGGGGPRRWALLAFGQSVGTLAAYALTNALPFDSFSIAWDARQVLYLGASYLALTTPFFFSGAIVGTLLSERSLASHRVYAANLAGSGAGCLVALAGLAWLGGAGVIAVAALMAMLAALGFEWTSLRRSPPFIIVIAGSIGLIAVWTLRPPDGFTLRLSPYKGLSAALRFPDARIISTRWNASSRVDHVQSAGIRSLPGLSFTFRGSPPPQDGLTFDGDDLSPIPLIDAQQASFAPHMLIALPFALRPNANALILEPRGGLDVLVALASGAQTITAVEPNELAVEAARSMYADPRTRVVINEPRAFVERSAEQFDVIDLALTAPYRPVTSGAYSLAEDYRLTAEAFDRYLSRLKPGGLLAVVRWLQTPPSEEMRLIGLAAGAVRRAGGDPAQSIVALRGYATALVLVRRGDPTTLLPSGSAGQGFTPDELASIRAFADSRRFDLIAAPGLRPEEANRYNVLPDDAYYRLAASLLKSLDPSPVYASYPFDIAPPTDDHPLFGHFFKWSQASEVLAALGKTWQPFGGAGYFVLVALLILSSLAAIALIIAPLSVPHPPTRLASLEVTQYTSGEREPLSPLLTTVISSSGEGPGVRSKRSLRLWTLGYFGLLGIGFLFVEIPIIQQYILLIGRPTTALAVVLFALLMASGLGSLTSRRVPWRAGALGLTAAIAIYPSAIRAMSGAILTAPIEARLVAGGLALAPLGFLMGTLFPKGIAYLEDRAPEWVPWAWGINGAASVISAITSALLALTFGFSFVIACGAACYGACALLVKGTKLTAPRL